MDVPHLAAEQWSCGARVGVLATTPAVAGLCQRGFRSCNRVMKRTGGVGIVGLELIRSQERAAPVLARWGRGPGWRAARWSLVIDMPFLVAYGAGLWTLAAMVADHAATRGWPWWADAVRLVGWSFAVAAVLDLVENCSLVGLLHGKAVEATAKVAWACALAKFVLLAVGILALLSTAFAFLGP